MPLARDRFSGAFSNTIAMITGTTDMAKNPRLTSKGIRRVFDAKTKKIIKIGVTANEIASILRRPKRSLKEPARKAPSIPATWRIVKEAPATHRLEPSLVRKVGK